jgi:hypothetical protein
MIAVRKMACALFLVATGARADIVNDFGISASHETTIDPWTNAFELQLNEPVTVTGAWVVSGYSLGTGTAPTIELSLHAPHASDAGPGTKLASLTIASVPEGEWVGGSFSSGALALQPGKYLLVISQIAGSMSARIRVASPKLDLDPWQSEPSERSLYFLDNGTWKFDPGDAPIFALTTTSEDPFAAHCPPGDRTRVLGNPYTNRAPLANDHPVLQRFYVLEAPLLATAIEVPLAGVTGPVEATLRSGGQEQRGLLADAGASTGGWRRFQMSLSPPMLLSPGEPHELELVSTGNFLWQASGEDVDVLDLTDACAIPRRATFQGAAGHAVVDGTDELDIDLLFRVTTCAPPLSFCLDADEDGRGDPSTLVPGCAAPDAGYRSDIPCDDCNDHQRGIHPSAVETCGDGVDNDCSPSTSDECAEPPPPACVDCPQPLLGWSCGCSASASSAFFGVLLWATLTAARRRPRRSRG